MKLKSVSMCVGLMLCAGCANKTEPFSVSSFFPLTPGCSEIKEPIYNGYLDVAAGSAQYFIGVRISGAKSITQKEVEGVGGPPLEPKDRNVPLVTQMVVSYELSKRVGATPKPYITNFSSSFDDKGEIVAPVQIISPELAMALFDGLTPSPGVAPSAVIEDFVDIIADVEFRGEFSASKHSFSTGSLGFPIRAYRSNPVACANGYIKFFERSPGPSDGGTNPTTSLVEPCAYVGQSRSQLAAPPAPSVCCSGPGGGAGC